MLLAGVPGVVLGGSLILQVPDRWAEIALGLLTGGLGVYSMMKSELGQHYAPATSRSARLIFWAA